MHVIAGKAVCFKEALSDEFKECVKNIDSKTVQDTGTTISTVNIDALEKMASVKLDNNQEIKDAIKNKKWEDLNFDLSNQDTVKDLNVRNYIANKNYDIDEIIKDARNGDSTALDAVNTISELIRNENSKTEEIGDNADERAKKEAIAAANKTGTNNLQYLTGATNGIMENILGTNLIQTEITETEDNVNEVGLVGYRKVLEKQEYFYTQPYYS